MRLVRLALLAVVAAAAAADPATGSHGDPGTPPTRRAPAPRVPVQVPLLFEEYGGAPAPGVALVARGRGRSLFLSDDGISVSLGGREGRWTARLRFLDARPGVRCEGTDRAETVVSMFRGPRERWRTGLRTYAGALYRDLWPGIDLALRGTMDGVKYEFRVAPGADPARIRMRWEGADVSVDADGGLSVETPAGAIRDDRPVSWQEGPAGRIPVDSDFAISGASTVGFRVGAFDPALPLVIDPAVLVYCGFVGGAGLNAIAVDATGAAYVAGNYSEPFDMPTRTVGPDTIYNGGGDVFVAKVNAQGTGYVYAGFIGGSEWDVATAIAVDSSGSAYLAGHTESGTSSFPVTGGPDLTYGGGRDAFVAKIDPTGTALTWCGFVGGSGLDEATGIALDATGAAWICGTTRSSAGMGFPLAGPGDSSHNGDNDAFVCRVAADGSGLLHASYVGGDEYDVANGIAVDPSGNAWVVGMAQSGMDTFPLLGGPVLSIVESDERGNAAFLAKVAPAGGLVSCGYLTLSTWGDYAFDVAVDAAGAAYVAGITRAPENDFPVAVGPDLTYNGTDDSDVFVAKVAPDASGLVYCGYIGGSESEEPEGIAVDAAGRAFVVGATPYDGSPTGFPAIGGPDLTHAGSDDVFLAVVAADGSALESCGYIGGPSGDSVAGVALDASGNAYVAGGTSNDASTFPVLVGPTLSYSSEYGASFVAKISLGGAPPAPGALESFVLPKKISLKDGRLTVSGWLDTGSDAVDLADLAEVVVGETSFALEGEIDESGTRFRHEAPGLVLSVTASRDGSSRASFKLDVRGEAADALDPEGPLSLALEIGEVSPAATLGLTGGAYALGRSPGALGDPALYVTRAKAALRGGGEDSLTLVTGFATDGSAPEEAPDLVVGFGDSFEASVAGEDLGRKGDRFTGASADGRVKVVLDYAKETLTVQAKGVDLGAFEEAAPPVLVRVEVGGDVRTVRVRLGRKGTNLVY